jgi:S-disulfanyl-L-cysteine oxidoreductase SoxD
MRFTFALAVIACTSAMGAHVAGSRTTQQSRTVWDGIYTDGQARRGDVLYAQRCASCHGPDLGGLGQAPTLAGKDFTEGWLELSVGDLFERVRISMPADSPGSLPRPDVADVLAFMLSKSAYPAGQNELPIEMDTLKRIIFVKQKPFFR